MEKMHDVFQEFFLVSTRVLGYSTLYELFICFSKELSRQSGINYVGMVVKSKNRRTTDGISIFLYRLPFSSQLTQIRCFEEMFRNCLIYVETQ
jgi:hypothetical protein